MNVQEAFRHKLVVGWQKSKETSSVSFPSLLTGVEIEVEGCPSDNEFYTSVLSSLWDIKADGSLRGRNNGFRGAAMWYAWEFVTKPVALELLPKELEKFYNVTKFTDNQNFSDRTSVHVHANVLDFTQAQLGGLFLTYSVFEDVLFKFVGHYRDTNIYCIPWNQCRLNRDVIRNVFENIGLLSKWQKYTALNLLPISTQGTVEFRHMHGTADVAKLTTWVNLIGAIMRYAKETDFDEVYKVIKSLNTDSAYERFFNHVLQGFIPYSGDYRPMLYEGVCNAKYSLVTFQGKKEKQKQSDATVIIDDVVPEREVGLNEAQHAWQEIGNAAFHVAEAQRRRAVQVHQEALAQVRWNPEDLWRDAALVDNLAAPAEAQRVRERVAAIQGELPPLRPRVPARPRRG